MSVVKFTATRLNNTGKQGILKPDSDGYYTMPIGGLNAFNSVGHYYPLEGAKHLFESSSMFMRRVAEGALYAELGHPKQTPGMSNDDYLQRILTLEETNLVAHFKEIWLDGSYGKNNPEFKNPNLIAIMAKVKPAGPKGHVLKGAFENINENVFFSIRALTRDFVQRSVRQRVLDTIITFDNVNLNGIANANKWSSPALESICEQSFTTKQLERIVHSEEIAATESCKSFATEALRVININTRSSKPLYTKW